MNKIYLQFKGKEVNIEGFKGILCGYTETNFILSLCEGNPIWSFEEQPQGAFIDEEFKNSKCKFAFADEKQLWE